MNAPPDGLMLFLQGATATACAVAGLLFLAYRRDSGERLFLYFAGAFWVLAVNYVAVAAIAPTAETRHWFYAVRLVAFAFILTGIADKNRRGGG